MCIWLDSRMTNEEAERTGPHYVYIFKALPRWFSWWKGIPRMIRLSEYPQYVIWCFHAKIFLLGSHWCCSPLKVQIPPPNKTHISGTVKRHSNQIWFGDKWQCYRPCMACITTSTEIQRSVGRHLEFSLIAYPFNPWTGRTVYHTKSNFACQLKMDIMGLLIH